MGIIKRSEKQIVKDEKLDFGQAVKRFEMRTIGFGLEEGFKQARSAQIKHGVAQASSEVAEGASEVTFAHAGGTGYCPGRFFHPGQSGRRTPDGRDRRSWAE